MKKVFIAMCIMSICFINSCTSKDPSGNSETARLSPSNVITVEGCEYFVVFAYGSYTYVHKGNCKNPIHYENKSE